MVGVVCSVCAVAGYFSDGLGGLLRGGIFSLQEQRRKGADAQRVPIREDSSDSEPEHRLWPRAKMELWRERQPEI